ncbi:hypothetical protein [Psychrosphaera aestuarii]|uniref:hypothetical protein n=1 Tax=Psychrosphaera aestuarii TaxID=1266052 RepID=UPI001B31B190|nr:hypothetical protein [Psychrosphaera aestuarii]
MGWFSKSKGTDPLSVFNKYRNRARITSSHYIDPDGFEYPKSCVGCHDCIFRTKGGLLVNGCKIYDKPDSEMAEIVKNVISSNYCEYFLDRSFDDADEARKELG